MSDKLKSQLMLLREAIGDVIDRNPNVYQIRMIEIWKWIDDILGELE